MMRQSLAPPRGTPFLEILIPTYNRAAALERTLTMVAREIVADDLCALVAVAVGDNASLDRTGAAVTRVRALYPSLVLRYECNDHNLGYEPNAVALVRRRTAPCILFLGDDDALPSGYIARVVALLHRPEGACCVLPGFESVEVDGRPSPAGRAFFRDARFDARYYRAGTRAIVHLALLGHQLSGVAIRATPELARYERCLPLRNLYPTIAYVGAALRCGGCWYLPGAAVLVTQGNQKDWRYDRHGLLGDILRNYEFLLPRQPVARFVAGALAILRQPWRLQLGMAPPHAVARAVAALLRDPVVPTAIKGALPFLLPAAALNALWREARQRARGARRRARICRSRAPR